MNYDDWLALKEETEAEWRRAAVLTAQTEEERKQAQKEFDAARTILRRARAERNAEGKELRAANSAHARAQKNYNDIEAKYKRVLAAEPPEGPEPPTYDDPGDQELAEYIATLPEIMRAKMPAFQFYVIPKEEDCDWIITPNTATSTKGLGTITGTSPMGRAYQVWRQAGNTGRCTFGVRGAIGPQQIGHGWGHVGVGTIHWRLPDGTYDNLDIEIVGLDKYAEMSIGIGNKYGFVDSLRVFNIGLRGGGGNFIVSTSDGDNDGDVYDEVGDILFDGIWYLNDKDWSPGQYSPHTSAFHLGDHRSLVLRRIKLAADVTGEHSWRGTEHTHYDKSSWTGPTWIVQNNMKGGNRTWFQRRPDIRDNVRPMGDYMVLMNEGDSYGWDHGEGGETFAGGSAMSVWTAPDDRVFVAGNRVADAKYGCLMLGGQGPDRDWYVEDETGQEEPYVIKEAWVWDNYFENAHIGHLPGRPKRNAVALSSVKDLHIGKNTFANDARLCLYNKWAAERHGMDNGTVRLYGDHSNVHVRKYDPAIDNERELTAVEREALEVPELV